jgi:hypothetical protein
MSGVYIFDERHLGEKYGKKKKRNKGKEKEAEAEKEDKMEE